MLDIADVLLHDSVSLSSLDVGVHILYGRLYRADNLPLRPALLISLDRIRLIAKSALPAAVPLAGLLKLGELAFVRHIEWVLLQPGVSRLLRNDASVHKPRLHHLLVKSIELVRCLFELWEHGFVLRYLLRAVIRRPVEFIPERLFAALCSGDCMLVKQIILEVHKYLLVLLKQRLER
ncbi:hypothetical protein D3C75_983260 [compost metagenome]